MKVQLLSGGGINDPREQYLTSFVINNQLAVDAGALPMALGRDKQLNLHSIFITHPHLDHLAGLPLMLDNIFSDMNHTVRVYAIEDTVQSLRNHIFNNIIWPDFTSFKNSRGVNLQFEIVEPNKTFQLGSLHITPVPVNHTVPTVGLVIEDENSAVVLSSDTGDTEDLWAAARQTKHLSTAFIECSYPDRLATMAETYGHLCTSGMMAQADKIGRDNKIFAYHIKPAYMHEVWDELNNLKNERVKAAEPNMIYEF